MNKFFVLIFFVLLFNLCIFSQTKSLADAQKEFAAFSNSQNFSVIYDQSKYVTKAEVTFDILEPKTPLSKQFKEFGFQITTLFSTDGIDAKPIRTTLCIKTYSNKFYFSSDRNLTLLVDNESIPLGEANRSTEVKGRKIRESLCWEIDKEFVKDLGKAADIGYEIGKINGTIDSTKLQFFRDYAKLILIEQQ